MKRYHFLAAGGLLLMASGMVWAAEGGDDSRQSSFPGITAPAEEEPPPPPKKEPAKISGQDQAKEQLKSVISISFTNADLRNVLSGLAKTYGLNIVTGETVKGSVNLTLKDVTLGEVLRQILRPNGYTFVWEDSILRVVGLEEEVVTEVLPLNFVQSDLAMEFLKKEASESGVMKADEVQGGILITDKASNLEMMKAVLKKIDLPPQQVLIQARLLDVTHTDSDNLGLKLSSLSFTTPLRVGSPEGSERLLSIASGSVDLSGPSSDLTTDTMSATVSYGSKTVTAAIDALIRNKRVKVLASPTIGTLNNVEAKITIGEKFPIQETTQTTTGTLQTTRFVDVGITLRVTPKINKAGYIQMQIHPEVSSVSSTIDAGPRITTREADTTIIIRDRESVIIAGLLKEEETITRDRVPILGHIPFIGLLFSNRAKTYEQKELVIVITPYLMPVENSKGVEDSELQKAHVRMNGTELYRQANDFEFGKSLQVQDLPDVVRLLRAVDLYEGMADAFPSHALAPDALWRAGGLAWDRLKDHERAKELFTRLSAQYPQYPLAAMARRRAQEIQDYLARQGRNARHADVVDREKPRRPQNFSISGFR